MSGRNNDLLTKDATKAKDLARALTEWSDAGGDVDLLVQVIEEFVDHLVKVRINETIAKITKTG